MTQIIDATVAKTRSLSSDVMQIDLRPQGGDIPFEPGGHIDVHVPIGSSVETRSYSQVAAGADGSIRIAVKRVANSRGGSEYMHSLRPGDRVSVSSDRNNFPLSYGAKSYALLAGGIGITPIVSMAHALAGAGKDFTLLYCVRSAGDAAFAETLAADFGDRFVLHDDSRDGVLDSAAFIASLDPDTELYMCGPIPMMDAVRRAWQAAERPITRLRFETFGTGGQGDAVAFTVTVKETGATVSVPPNMSMLEALVGAGQSILYDCKRGECGLCKVEIEDLHGRIDHRDVFLSDREHAQNRSMCACVSRIVGGDAVIRTDSISHGRES